MNQILKVEPLHHQVYLIVKSNILEGGFQPGERIVELKLAEKFGVSRGPVREAIRMLLQDGLLVQKEGVIQVFNPDRKDILEVFTCRQSLESLAAKLAADHITTEQLKRMEAILQDTDQAFRDENSHDLSLFDQQFHDIVIEASGNQQLIQLMEVIKAKIVYIRNCIIRNFYRHFLDFNREHHQIYQALAASDGKRAEELMRSHIERNLQVSYTLIQQQ